MVVIACFAISSASRGSGSFSHVRDSLSTHTRACSSLRLVEHKTMLAASMWPTESACNIYLHLLWLGVEWTCYHPSMAIELDLTAAEESC